ncbi:MAG TPA: tail fiber domain-containing protein [candidate division Zixibacteria bacterium]|nr:tail fiber domain-containing protein [candidate division Zixibacteria bacterium]
MYKKCAFIAVLLVLMAAPIMAQDQLVSYQGLLTGSDGNPVSDSYYQLTFAIYDDSTAGTQLWSEIRPSVFTSGGTFHVMLGSITPLDASIFESSDLFLQITVGTDSPIQPRTRLCSVPKAAMASRVDGDIKTGEGYTDFKDSDGSTAVTIGTEEKGGTRYLTMYNPNAEYQTQTLVKLQSAIEGGSMEFFPAGDYGTDPTIRMGIEPVPWRSTLSFFDPTSEFSGLSLATMGVEPSPFHDVFFRMSKPSMTAPYDLLQMRAYDSTGQWQSDFTLMSSNVSNMPVIKMGVEPSPFKGSITLFNQRDGGYSGPVVEMSTNTLGGAGIRMFDPQPEPPGVAFEVITDYSSKGDKVTMNLTDNDTDIQTTLTPGLVRVGSSASTYHAHAELATDLNVATFYLQGISTFAPGQAISMEASETEAKVGIGTFTPSEALHVVGNICYTGTIGACSDGRYKEAVEDLTGALDKVTDLRGVNYRWKTEDYPEKHFDNEEHVGFIAQEVQQVVPEIVQEHADGTLSVDYGRLTPLLVEAIKELRQENKDLKARIEQLEKR